ncbi:MAG TPA: PhzF family phenazine biosynthesis isomerase [Dehalococcoidia bacterium]|nr:PhzF family phenazine biosynthesis isomerase [Dehalococcoidia bacterium]
MTEVQVVRVFTDADGNHGNPLGIVLDTAELDDARRQAIAAELDYSETVFVDDVARAELRIFTPAAELPLAGHPLVGTAWLLAQVTGRPVETLRPLRAANVDTWVEDGVTWIRARIEDAPPWRFVRLDAPGEVEALAAPPGPEYGMHEFWAWQDEAEGRLRARVFASSFGIAEDEATGSGALRLIELLGRELVITQGRGSVLYARPAKLEGRGEVGGRVVSAGTREV